jgi:hypothetical protein
VQAGGHVRIGVQRDRDIRVAQPLLNDLWVNAGAPLFAPSSQFDGLTGSGSRGSSGLFNGANVTIGDNVDLDLARKQWEFEERAGRL